MSVHLLLHIIRALGLGRRRRRRAVGAVAIVLAGLRLVLWASTDPNVRSWLGIGVPTCAAAKISTSDAREGICARNQGLFGGGTVYNVVDAGHVLRMPDYDVRLLGTTVTPTTVTNPETDPTAWPEGRGLLVSVKIAVTNERATPLAFDRGGRDADLLMSDLDHPGSDISFPDLPNANGEPGPSIADAGQITPHATATGWLSFVSPIWSQEVLHVRATDLEFYTPGHTATSYVGQIRMWKWATAQGQAALGVPAARSRGT